MILNIVGIHNATKSFTKIFTDAFPDKVVTVCLKGKGNGADLLIEGKEYSFQNEEEVPKMIDFSQISVVIVHLVTFQKEHFILKHVSPDVPVIWWVYGGDLYNHFLMRKGYKLYASQTLPFVLSNRNSKIILKKTFFDDLYRPWVEKRFLRRIKGIIPCEQPDYDLACELLERKLDLVNISPRSKRIELPFAEGEDICVGHSASMTNNHLYALEIIKRIPLNNSKLVLPLSYNVQSEDYKEVVMNEYRKWFGKNVSFLLDYQSLDEYRKEYLNYKVALYPCWRQEALGNIFICLQLGVKVFLSIHNPCYQYFKKLGYYIYAMEDITEAESLNPLSQIEKDHNRNLYLQISQERNNSISQTVNDYFSKYV